MKFHNLEDLRTLSEEHGSLEREAMRVQRLLEWARSEAEREHARERTIGFLDLLASILRAKAKPEEETLAGTPAGVRVREEHRTIRRGLDEALEAAAAARDPEAFGLLKGRTLSLIHLVRRHMLHEEQELFDRVTGVEGPAPGPMPPALRAKS